MTPACPLPLADYPVVTLAHGGGGRMMRRLIRDLFAAAFGPDTLQSHRDSAVLVPPPGHRLAFTTDAFVVKPLFFPGGDIGSLAINGTVNDLAMAGARPLALSCAMILEEGLPMETLWRIAQSMKQAADAAGVAIVTGDTKVVDKGKGDGLFIATSGIGAIPDGVDPGPHRIQPGDAVIVNGDVGRHGMAIVAAREELALSAPIESDGAPLAASVAALFDAGIEVHALRDATRGGIASAVIELAADAHAAISLDEATIPVREEVRGICELLGFDPLYVANEGRFVCFVPGPQAEAALTALRGMLPGADPAVIGTVTDATTGRVTLTSLIGARRPLDLLSGEQLPRIC